MVTVILPFDFNVRLRSGRVWRVTRPDEGGQRVPLRIFKSNSHSGKIHTALERSRRTVQVAIILFTCNVTGRSNKVTLY